MLTLNRFSCLHQFKSIIINFSDNGVSFLTTKERNARIWRKNYAKRSCLHVANTQVLSGISTIQITQHILVIIFNDSHYNIRCWNSIGTFCFLKLSDWFDLSSKRRLCKDNIILDFSKGVGEYNDKRNTYIYINRYHNEKELQLIIFTINWLISAYKFINIVSSSTSISITVQYALQTTTKSYITFNAQSSYHVKALVHIKTTIKEN